MLTHILPPDTQAMLLLCASFCQNRQTEPQPLTLGEYNILAGWLRENDMTPADLLHSTFKNRLPKITIDKLDSNRLAALLERGLMLSLAVEKWTNQGLWILGRSDAQYPKRLKQKLRYLAPAILYGVGNTELLSQGGLAIVGSRDVDEEGLNYTQRVAQTCVRQGIQVVSGGARGVDQASMLGALEAGGTVVGVLADSLAKAAVARKYRAGIKEGRLALISAYEPNVRFHAGNAMRRNKYIYALADFALVVSSSVQKGGTWTGAVEALEKIKNVPVLVRMQGNVPEGNRQLVKKGAKPFPDFPWIHPLRELVATASSEVEQAEAKRKDETKVVVQQPSILSSTNTSEPVTQSSSKNVKEEASKEVADAVMSVTPQSSEAEVELAETEEKEKSSLVAGAPANEPQEDVTDTKAQVQARPKDIYEAVLPFILQHLEQPKDDKSLAECLDIQVGQMRAWLKRAVEEGKVKKNKKPVTYEVNWNEDLLSLLESKRA
ncbi:MAG: DNA-processing protein DprA [Xenococcaceae cyanobacterium]